MGMRGSKHILNLTFKIRCTGVWALEMCSFARMSTWSNPTDLNGSFYGEKDINGKHDIFVVFRIFYPIVVVRLNKLTSSAPPASCSSWSELIWEQELLWFSHCTPTHHHPPSLNLIWLSVIDGRCLVCQKSIVVCINSLQYQKFQWSQSKIMCIYIIHIYSHKHGN